MPGDESPIVITNRDVYELLKTHIETNAAWQVSHAAADQKSFNSLNGKIYGVLGTLAVTLAALAAAIVK